jgi:alkanesulfonate monooxygenase SsuD/methylene tetrahydromethanopterin reductase-like flavin-dependent oxidoreductase (luciferase family)
MSQVWSGAVIGASGLIPALPRGRPRVLIGGLVPASFARVAEHADGWVAPSFGMQTLTHGITSARRAWSEAGRQGQPRIVVERYFSLGGGADEVADHYLMHYYGSDYFPDVRADALTSRERILDQLQRLAEVGCDDVVLLPCSAQLDQVELLADAVSDSFKTTQNPFGTKDT